jgi:hypothetical protein
MLSHSWSASWSSSSPVRVYDGRGARRRTQHRATAGQAGTHRTRNANAAVCRGLHGAVVAKPAVQKQISARHVARGVGAVERNRPGHLAHRAENPHQPRARRSAFRCRTSLGSAMRPMGSAFIRPSRASDESTFRAPRPSVRRPGRGSAAPTDPHLMNHERRVGGPRADAVDVDIVGQQVLRPAARHHLDGSFGAAVGGAA